MLRILRLATIAVVALALAALAGCGDTASNNEYVDAVNKAQTDFAASVSKVQADAAGTTPEKAKEVFTSLGDGVDKVVSDLKAVSAPDKVEDLHDQLIDQVSSFGTAIKKAGDSITGNDPRKITEAQTKFATEIASVGTMISSTIDEINKKLQE